MKKFLFSINVCVFIPTIFFIVMWFLFSVNACVFIPMMLFYC